MAVVLPFGPAGEPSIERLSNLVRADLQRVNDLIVSRTGSEVTMIPEVANHLISSRREAAATDADAFDRDAHRLSRRRPYPARRRRRVHAHRDAAARRRGGRQRNAPRQACRPHAVEGTRRASRRRFPARPGVPHDGRGRLDPRAGNSFDRGGRDRRRRSDAACRSEEPRHHGRCVSCRDPRQDRRAVRRRLRRSGPVLAKRAEARRSRPAVRSA